MKLFNLLDITDAYGMRAILLCDDDETKHRKDLQGTMTNSKWYSVVEKRVFFCSICIKKELKLKICVITLVFG